MISSAMPRRAMHTLTVFAICFLLIPAAPSLALDLETVQEAIRLSGARWVAGETSVSGLSDEEKKKLVGLLPEPEVVTSLNQTIFRAPITAPLPSSWDWSNIGGDTYVSPAKHQGLCGSCWAFAGVGALESYVMLRTHQPGMDIDLSEQSILSCETSGGCGGGSGWTVATIFRDTGVPAETCLPYAADDDGNICDERCDDWELEARTISKFQRVLGSTNAMSQEEIIDTLKSNLTAYGPLWTSMQVYGDFYHYDGEIYEYTSGDYDGGHAVLLIGYDDVTETFKVKNSWGTGWGNNGIFRIAYSQVANRIEFGAFTYAYGDPVDIGMEAPTANAGPDRTAAENEVIILDGTASSDPDGQIDAYTWRQLSSPQVSLTGADTPRPSFTAPDLSISGDHPLRFELTVTDDDGLPATDTVTVTIDGVNERPTAQAGGDLTVAEGGQAQLDGSASGDPDGRIDTFAWRQLGSPQVSLTGADTARPSFTAPNLVTPADTDLVFELTVTDDGGLTATDTVTVTVNWVNDPPRARAGGDLNVADGTQVQLDGSASTDTEGDIAGYQWVQDNEPKVSLAGADTARPSFTAPDLITNEDATLVFRLIVTDAHNGTDTDWVRVTVSWVNDPPTARAGENRVVSEGDSVQLDGSASDDAEGQISTYQWGQQSGPQVSLESAGTARPSFTAPDLTTADNVELVFSLTVTDTEGATATDRVTITVTAENAPPTAEAGEAQTVETGDAVTLDAGASSDPDDGIATYAWTQTDGPEVELSAPSEAQTSFTAPANDGTDPLQLRFELQVTDAGGLSAIDSVEIWITPQENPTDPTDPQDPGDNPDDPDAPKDTPEPDVKSSGGGSGGCFVTSAKSF